MSPSNKLTEQAALDGGAVKGVLRTIKSTAQFLVAKYLRFLGGEFAPTNTHGVCK